MRFFSANKIHNGFTFLPADSVVAVDHDGTIENIFPAGRVAGDKIEKLNGILCPGFVNTHCHLELSYLKGRIGEGRGLHEFIKDVERLKRDFDEEMNEAIEAADKEMFANGVVACGDICNTNYSFITKVNSSVYYHNFFEVYAFDPARADNAFLRGKKLADEWSKLDASNEQNFSITPHAPYSASPRLLQLISDYSADHENLLSIHMQESEDEDLLFTRKTGNILERLRGFGIDTDSFTATGISSLRSALIHLPRDKKMLFVHNTFMRADDIEFAKEYNHEVYFCFCPRANLYIENRIPELALFKEDCRITLGTDSLASNHSLSVYDEIRAIRSNSSVFSLEELLRFGTSAGAEFLGISNWAGSLHKGKRPGLVLINEQNHSIRRIA